MQGYTHALSGAAAWLALTSSSEVALGVSHQPAPVTAGGAVVCAGAALLPDWDHPSGTIAHSLWPVSKPIARGIAQVSGGHRHGTHSLLGVGVFAVLAYAASVPTAVVHGKSIAVGGAVVAMICVAFAAKALGLTQGLGFRGIVGDILKSPLGAWFAAIGVTGAITWFLDYRWAWLAPCVALGCLVHNVGDMLTPEGVPWLWPWNPKTPKWWPDVLGWFWHSNGYFRLPVLGTVERRKRGRTNWFNRETWVGIALSMYVVYIAMHTVAVMRGVALPYVA